MAPELRSRIARRFYPAGIALHILRASKNHLQSHFSSNSVPKFSVQERQGRAGGTPVQPSPSTRDPPPPTLRTNCSERAAYPLRYQGYRQSPDPNILVDGISGEIPTGVAAYLPVSSAIPWIWRRFSRTYPLRIPNHGNFGMSDKWGDSQSAVSAPPVGGP